MNANFCSNRYLLVEIDVGQKHVWHVSSKMKFKTVWDMLFQEMQLIPYGLALSVMLLQGSRKFIAEVRGEDKPVSEIEVRTDLFMDKNDVVTALVPPSKEFGTMDWSKFNVIPKMGGVGPKPEL